MIVVTFFTEKTTTFNFDKVAKVYTVPSSGKSWVDYEDSPVQHELADEAHACEMNIVFDLVYCGDFYEINNASDYIKIPCKLMPVSYNDVRYIPITDDIFAKGRKIIQ